MKKEIDHKVKRIIDEQIQENKEAVRKFERQKSIGSVDATFDRKYAGNIKE